MTKHVYAILFALTLCCATPLQSMASSMIEIIENEQQQPKMEITSTTIRVVGGQGLTLYIYDVTGVCVQSIKIDSPDKTMDLTIGKGCYIFKVGKTARKVSIK